MFSYFFFILLLHQLLFLKGQIMFLALTSVLVQIWPVVCDMLSVRYGVYADLKNALCCVYAGNVLCVVCMQVTCFVLYVSGKVLSVMCRDISYSDWIGTGATNLHPCFND
eukprot:TRINITY_DN126301_c0_g2_i2.p1 TRINITY_DN126301_c0_g2~~TRINITY_DN126301_c0_g2_i2.p1  ORF type:complete len:110 (-),score=3.50 TRINITY_DN126301_c0_g2_i2:229-558(-)